MHRCTRTPRDSLVATLGFFKKEVKQMKNFCVGDLGIPEAFVVKTDVNVEQVSECRICSGEGGGLICD